MKCSVVTALDHYERLITENNDSCEDNPMMQSYMARWDGPPFWMALGDLESRRVLEIGVGTGRVVRQLLLRGCGHVTGVDFSQATIARAESNLEAYTNVDLLVTDICDFCQPETFDVACSVLTFMHIENKPKALRNIVTSLRAGGHLVLSIDHAGDWLDFGNRRVELHPAVAKEYVAWLRDLGCYVDNPIPLVDTWLDEKGKKLETYGQTIATLIKAKK